MKQPSYTAAHASALWAASEVGLLPCIGVGEFSATTVARELGLDGIATHRVHAVLELCEPNERSASAVSRAKELVDSLRGLEGLLWRHVPHYLRCGETLLELVGRPSTYATVVAGLAELFEPDANGLAAQLPIPAGARLLDVGAGSGVWSLAMAACGTDVHVTALDFAEVLPRFEERAVAMGLADRIATIAESYLVVEVPPGSFDVVILANVLHLEAPLVARDMVARFARALRSGGRLIVVDVFSDGSRDHERSRAAYALHLGARIRNGFPHRRADVESWLRDAGLAHPTLIPCQSPRTLLSALVSTRP